MVVALVHQALSFKDEIEWSKDYTIRHHLSDYSSYDADGTAARLRERSLLFDASACTLEALEIVWRDPSRFVTRARVRVWMVACGCVVQQMDGIQGLYGRLAMGDGICSATIATSTSSIGYRDACMVARLGRIIHTLWSVSYLATSRPRTSSIKEK